MPESVNALRWDEGDPIVGTPFRHMVMADETGGAFSAQSAVMAPGELVVPHTHTREDEFTIVLEGRVGALVGTDELEVVAGSVLKKPRGVMHAMWNATNAPAVVIEVITPAGFEKFFAEMAQRGAEGQPMDPGSIAEVAARYGETFHFDLIGHLRVRHRLSG